MSKRVNRLKASFYYSVRELKRRPRETVALVLISTAVLLALIMTLMYMEAQWRAEVMPDHEDNYHFYVQNLTASEKDWIRQQEWTQAAYDTDDSYRQFRVRVTWDYAGSSMQLTRLVFDTFDLWSREPYAKRYIYNYNDLVRIYEETWYGAKSKGGYTIAEMATIGAKTEIVRNMTRNRHFCVLTGTDYMVRPDNVITIMLFSMFLGAAITIIFAERYKRNLAEYGSLRAIGFTKGQVYAVYIIESLIITASALIPAWLISTGAVKLYWVLTENMRLDGDNVFLTLLDNVPVSNILISFAGLLIASSLGAALVCRRYSRQSVTDLLHSRQSFTVSFVSKTSPRFDAAKGAGIYPLLYTTRTKKSMLLNSLSTVIMIPLPMYYISMLIAASVDGGETARLTLAYFGFQVTALLITAAVVITVSSLYYIRGRKRELSTLRAIGMSKTALAKNLLPSALLQGGFAVIASSLLSALLLTLMVLSVQSVGNNTFGYLVQILLLAIANMWMTMAIILPFELSGIYGGLYAITKGSITEGIREVE